MGRPYVLCLVEAFIASGLGGALGAVDCREEDWCWVVDWRVVEGEVNGRAEEDWCWDGAGQR